MTEETLEKAEKLKKDINEIRDNIYGLQNRKRKAKEVPSYGSNCRWKWLMRFRKVEEKAVVFDNDNVCGTEIIVDEELLDLIISYFENKLSAKEKEFQELN